MHFPSVEILHSLMLFYGTMTNLDKFLTRNLNFWQCELRESRRDVLFEKNFHCRPMHHKTEQSVCLGNKSCLEHHPARPHSKGCAFYLLFWAGGRSLSSEGACASWSWAVPVIQDCGFVHCMLLFVPFPFFFLNHHFLISCRQLTSQSVGVVHCPLTSPPLYLQAESVILLWVEESKRVSSEIHLWSNTIRRGKHSPS